MIESPAVSRQRRHTSCEWRPLGELLKRPPAYGINAAATAFDPVLPTYVRITDITDDGAFAPDPRVSVDDSRSASYFLDHGDLVFARTGASVGKSYRYRVADGPLVYAGFLIRITPDPRKLDPEFLAYFAQWKRYWDWVRGISVRSGQPGINGVEYASMPVPVPSLEVQHDIAAALLQVDSLLAATAGLLAKKRHVKAAVAHTLLTASSRLPGFRGRWERVKLGQLAEVVMGQSPSSTAYNSTGDGLPLIQGNADLHNHRVIERVWTTQVTKRCRAGDLIMTVRAPVGALGIATNEACLGRGVCALRPRVDSRYLFQALLFSEARWAALEQGSTFTAANSTEVKSFGIDIPSESAEQKAIGGLLTNLDEEMAGLRRRQGKLRDIRQGMLQQLFGQFTMSSPVEAAE